MVSLGHKALSAGRLSEGTLGIPRPYRAKIAISTKLNFFPKKYSRKVTKIILNHRRFVLSAICLCQMYLIPDCYRTSNDFQISSKQFFGLPFDFRFQTTPIIFNKIFLSSIFLNFFVKIFSTSFPKFFLNFSWKILFFIFLVSKML